uniref:Uncharacterized protein n=1 Tax=Anguilla anguilla TaxID=7936 RepID=A0A0E9T8A5_ANGAN
MALRLLKYRAHASYLVVNVQTNVCIMHYSCSCC